jgi:plasmid stability protein
MKNITIAVDEGTLAAGREYAKAHHTSLNALLRHLLRQMVVRRSSSSWTEELFKLADRAGGRSRGKRWKREDLYEPQNVH